MVAMGVAARKNKRHEVREREKRKRRARREEEEVGGSPELAGGGGQWRGADLKVCEGGGFNFTRGNPNWMVGGWWSLYRVGWLSCLCKYPRYLSRASGDRVRDRRSCIRTPIPMKLRPARLARRARRSYLTAVTFRHHFSAPHKIIRLVNKRGLRSGGDGWSCAGCDGARV